MLTDLTFLKKIADTPEKIQKYIDLFNEAASENVATIKTGIENHDSKSIARAAHQLKSQLNYVGAKSLINLCNSLQDQTENNFDTLKPIAIELVDSVEKTIAELK